MNIFKAFSVLFLFLLGHSVYSINENHNSTPPPTGVYRKAPYVIYPGDPTKMTVLWQLYTTETSKIKWGTDVSCTLDSTTTTEYENDHQHKITITGLTEHTKYYYQVTTNGTTKTGNFVTSILDTDQELYFYAYGDTRTEPSDHNTVANQIILDYTNHPEHQSFIINTGDLVQDGDNEVDWDEQFFDSTYTEIQTMLATLPYMVALGNHEAAGVLFKKYFPFEMYDPDNSRYYYSFDYGPAHFTVIDQFTNYTYSRTWESAQYQWIVNDLATTTKPWKFILVHMPGWSAGHHYNDYKVRHYLQPLAETYNVQFFLSGHNHYYARAEVNGVHHITTGGGGAWLYTPINPNDPDYDFYNDPDNPYLVTTDESYHFTRFHITNDSIHMTAIRNDGTIIESQSFPVNANALPVELTDFTSIEQNCANTLKWTTASETNNIGFEIQHSVDGKNWTTVGWEKSEGDSSSKNSYAFKHRVVKGQNYYRLKQVDSNGEYHFSAIKAVTNKCNLYRLTVFPNPVTKNINVEHVRSNTLYEIFNLFGQKLKSDIYTGEDIDVSFLNNGAYIIRIDDKIGRFAVIK